jgi:uncharacterized membrane protein
LWPRLDRRTLNVELQELLDFVIAVLAVVGAFTVYGAWKRYWRRRARPTRELVFMLVLTPLVAGWGWLMVAFALLAADWLLQRISDWSGMAEDTFLLWSAAALAVTTIWYLFSVVRGFSLARAQEAPATTTVDPKATA